jgi:type I restriction enzyme S subunit
MSTTWQTSTIGELFAIDSGKSVTPKSRETEPRFPFLRTSNVFWGRVDLSEVDQMHFTPEELQEKNLRPGDLLVCEGGDIGRAALWTGELEVCAFQNHLHRLRPRAADVEPAFYRFFLEAGVTMLGLLDGIGNRTTIPNLSRNRLASLEVPKPVIEEQRAIAAVLSKVQEAVEVEGELVKVTRELKQAALRQLFTRGLRGEPQKETEIGPVPESWDVLTLDRVVKARSGSAFPHSYQGKTSGELPFYKVSDMNLPGNEVFMTRANHRLDRASANELGAIPFPKDAIVFPKVGGALLTNKKRRLTCESLMDNNMMGVVTLDPERCSPDFLQQWFETVDLRVLAAPGPLPSLNNSRLYECQIPLPAPDEQRSIATILRTIDDKIAYHEERQRLLRELFRTLLHDLMTGRRRVAGAGSAASLEGVA